MEAATGAVGDVSATTHVTILITGLEGTGQITQLLVWGLVDDSQTPNYSSVSTSQTPNYSSVDDSQDADWDDVAA